MQPINVTINTPLFLRFYARCFTFPYEEMGYELQHIFRQLERGEFSENEFTHLDQVLNVINNYQGEEIKIVRENYVMLFSQWEGGSPLCPLIASDFMHTIGKPYDPETFFDHLMESAVPVNTDEPLDSLLNYLEYFSILCENEWTDLNFDELIEFQDKHIFSWIPSFCDRLYRSSNISFYKEVAVGLQDYLLQFSGE